MSFRFTYSLTEEEYAEYAAFSSWKAPWNKKNRLKYLLNSSFTIGVIGIALSIIHEKIDPRQKSSWGIFSILFVITVFAIGVFINYIHRPYQIKRQARKFINKEENTDLIKERQLEFSDDGISCSYHKSNSHIEWSRIVKYATTRDSFYLYINSESAYAIPKRIFSTQQEIDLFDKYLTEKIPLSASFRSL